MTQQNNLHTEQSEQKLLGLALFDNSLLTKIVGSIEPSDFYFNQNQILYKAINISYEKNSSADIPFLLEELSLLSTAPKQDWMRYFTQLISERGLESNIDKYIELIKEKRQARDLKDTLSSSVELVNSGKESVTELIGQVETQIQNITRQKELKNFEEIKPLTEEFLVKMDNIQKSGVSQGMRLGIKQLDAALGGLHGGQFIIIAARPSMGKTAFALDISKNIAKTKKTVGFFSLEMPAEQLIKRMLSSESHIDSRKLFNPKDYLDDMQKHKLDTAQNTIMNMSMRIDDSASLKINELAWKARKAKEQEGGLDLIVIDYLQLIDVDSNTKSESRQQMISDISRQLKALARELDIPVIALSQLSRRVESRDNKRPMMSDIRESGAIEQDADIIMFLYRDEYYKEKEKENISTNVDNSYSSLEVIIAKNRNGQTRTIKMGIDLKHSKIVPIQHSQIRE